MTATSAAQDQPLSDTTAYGNGPGDSVTDSTENAAITHHSATVAGRRIRYNATVGHLVTVDPSSSKPAAKSPQWCSPPTTCWPHWPTPSTAACRSPASTTVAR